MSSGSAGHVGSVGEEAAKLFAAAEEWLAGAAGKVGAAVGDLGAAHQGPECVVCPVCQLLAVLRTARPDVFEHLSQAAYHVTLAVKAAVDASERSWAQRRGGASFERIDIG